MNAISKQLRPYQKEAINQLRLSLGRGNKRVVIQGPTGFGKTLVAAKIIQGALAKGNRVIFTAPKIALIDQTIRAFESEGIYDIGAMQAQHPRTNPLAKVQVASVQTLARRSVPDADLIIVDECHEDHQIIRDVMDDRPAGFFIGLSATPWKKGMKQYWDDLVIPVTLAELIEQGYLSRFKVFAPSVPDLSGVRTQAGDYHDGDLERVMNDNILIADIVQTWLEKGENRPTLCFATSCNHAKEIFARFKGAGVAAAYCDAFTDKVEMDRIERDFRNGDVAVVCSVRKIIMGVDWPVGCIIDAAPTKSEMLHVQKIGRGLRVNPGTEDLIILDHASNSFRLGLVTDIWHAELDDSEKGERQKAIKKERLPKECANCGAVHSGLLCPYCGHERKPISGVENEDGTLVEVTPKREVTMDDKQRFWSMALHLDNQRGKGGRLAKALYKSKFKVWPRMLHNHPITPDAAFMNYERSRRIAYAKSKSKQGA